MKPHKVSMRSNTELTASLLVGEQAGIRRVNEPVTVGLPFAQGMVFDPACLTLWDTDDRELPLQVCTIARWSDDSVKWLLLDFQADVEANSQTSYQLRFASGESAQCKAPSLSVHELTEYIVVETGRATFFLNGQLCKPFDRVVIAGTELVVPQGSSLALTDEGGHACLPHIDDLAVETKGPLRVTIRARGEFKAPSRAGLGRFVVRLSFYAGSAFVQMQIRLHNPQAARHPGGLWDLGDEGSVYFNDLSLHIPMRTKLAPRVAWTSNPLESLKSSLASDLQIYQDSSGGENWRSTNHVNRFGRVMQRFRGYRVEAGQSLIEEGYRATPVLAIFGDNGGVAATVDKFWQNFPKALEVHDNQLVIGLFPRQYNDVFELQGGEQKTHTVYLGFSGQREEPMNLAWTHERLVPRATPEWYGDSEACPYLSPLSEDMNVECRELIDSAISGPQSFFARREIIDEYGWRHFGDLYADHEAVGHTGPRPLIAHYNNQYDVIYGTIAQYLRSGNRQWFELMTDLARHVIDIDIYHSNKDRPSYNGGLFWHTDHYLDAGTATHRAYSKAALANRDASTYGGGPSNEQNYTSGLLHCYYLTGDETARETVLSLADWVINMDDGSQRPFGIIDRRPTGLSSATASRQYHGPGRGAGNSINALLDAYVLAREERYFVRAEQLIRRCIHPKDDIKSRHLDDPEHRWSYLVFLQVLGKYLDCKIDEGEIDYMYAYAQASLLHYAEWMLEQEVPYATVLYKVEIPTETWPAQDIRKSVVLYLAAKHAVGPLRSEFQKKAEYFFQVCVRDLGTFATRTLTRPIVLLLTNAYVHSYFQNDLEESAPQPIEQYDFGRPQRFSPQFAELYWARERFSACLSRLVDWRQRMCDLLSSLTATSVEDEARGKQRATESPSSE